jgi:uncharacterized protein
LEIAMRVGAHTGLYDPSDDRPVLNGSECGECGRVYFPAMGIGCEICGADADRLRPRELAAAGVVHAVAEVHLTASRTPTPFTIAEIHLDAGPLIRAMIHPDATPAPAIGDRVVGQWSVVGRDESSDADVVEPAFVPEARS